MEEFNVEDLKKEGVTVDKEGRTSNSMDPSKCKQVVENVGRIAGIDNTNKTMAAIAGVCQRGGTNRSAGSVTASYTISGKTVTAGLLAQECKKVGGTPRQLARTMGTVIFRFASFLQEEGDLARQMSIENPNLSDDQKYWCSNFQTTNVDCPQDVRGWLVSNYNKRFSK